ncbi:hypothetical protein BDF19DRAFT_420582 [Syncephalis fuscata]|nr:hypothetical protein BDF19DRAFT_420582 [Syncephalis fuscata]
MLTANQIAQHIAIRLDALEPPRRKVLIAQTNASFLFCIQLPSGHEVYYTLNLKDDKAGGYFTQGAVGPTDVTIYLPIKTWSDVVAGRLCGPPSNRAGKHWVKGNKLLTYKLNHIFQSLAPMNKL